MSEAFDPYRQWLGIPPEEQPPDHYRLLGIARFERDRLVIENATLQRIASIEEAGLGEHAQARLKLILEIRAARTCLLNENRRRAYNLALERAEAQKAAQTVAQRDDLELVPLEDEPALKLRLRQPRPAAAAAEPAAAKPPQPPPPPKQPSPLSAQPPLAAPPAAPGATASLLDEELAPGGQELRPQTLRLSPLGWRRFLSRHKRAAGVFLALLTAVVLFRVLIRRNADDLLQQASNDYHSRAYAKAIREFDEYLEQFPLHSGVGLARVRRGLACLKQAAAGRADWPKAFRTAKDVLPEIALLDSFRSESRSVLGPLLCDIAEGLAAEAQKRADPGLREQAQQCLALIDKYVPASQQPAARLSKIRASLVAVKPESSQPKSPP